MDKKSFIKETIISLYVPVISFIFLFGLISFPEKFRNGNYLSVYITLLALYFVARIIFYIRNANYFKLIDNLSTGIAMTFSMIIFIPILLFLGLEVFPLLTNITEGGIFEYMIIMFSLIVLFVLFMVCSFIFYLIIVSRIQNYLFNHNKWDEVFIDRLVRIGIINEEDCSKEDGQLIINLKDSDVDESEIYNAHLRFERKIIDYNFEIR